MKRRRARDVDFCRYDGVGVLSGKVRAREGDHPGEGGDFDGGVGYEKPEEFAREEEKDGEEEVNVTEVVGDL
ncbi:hypothetical protein VNO78_25608 [Psophocarpus tetragonolobus]|uniref:Uncharacterized protein n=1 Tax=Psophocarpus tetragonolobus TaxID=3891 RepID=A0AAN9S784_PSOTE